MKTGQASLKIIYEVSGVCLLVKSKPSKRRPFSIPDSKRSFCPSYVYLPGQFNSLRLIFCRKLIWTNKMIWRSSAISRKLPSVCVVQALTLGRLKITTAQSIGAAAILTISPSRSVFCTGGRIWMPLEKKQSEELASFILKTTWIRSSVVSVWLFVRSRICISSYPPLKGREINDFAALFITYRWNELRILCGWLKIGCPYVAGQGYGINQANQHNLHVIVDYHLSWIIAVSPLMW